MLITRTFSIAIGLVLALSQLSNASSISVIDFTASPSVTGFNGATPATSATETSVLSPNPWGGINISSGITSDISGGVGNKLQLTLKKNTTTTNLPAIWLELWSGPPAPNQSKDRYTFNITSVGDSFVTVESVESLGDAGADLQNGGADLANLNGAAMLYQWYSGFATYDLSYESITVIPEPTSMALMTGCVALLGLRRRLV